MSQQRLRRQRVLRLYSIDVVGPLASLEPEGYVGHDATVGQTLPDWYVRNCDQMRLSLERLIEGEDEMADLLRDAVLRGRKLRSCLALQMREWCNWPLVSERQSELTEGLARIELLHAASCVLDDIIDGDLVRRGLPSFHARHGLAGGILTSLHMLVIALRTQTETAAHDGQTPVARRIRRPVDVATLLWRATHDTVIGEAWDTFLFQRNQGPVTGQLLWSYLGKTTPAFAVAHELVAVCTGRSDEERARTRTYGEMLGALYQVANDHNDWFRVEATARGTENDDVLITLSVPLILLLREQPRNAELIGKTVRRAQARDVLRLMSDFRIEQQSESLLSEMNDRALAAFPAGQAPSELVDFLRQIQTRWFWSYSYAAG